VKQITVFQQRAQYIVPVNDRPVSEEEKKEIYQNYDGIWDTVFKSLFAMGFTESKKSALEASEAERKEVYERIWNKGGGFQFSSKRSTTSGRMLRPTRRLLPLSGARSLRL
jgi:cyclohexanone monooxygenase